jgi:hypothetical protein
MEEAVTSDAIDTSVGPPPCGGLRERIDELTMMPERFGIDEAQGPALHAMVRRLALLRRMIDRIGVDEARGPLVSAILWQAEWACLDCVNAAECEAWTGSGVEEDAYREFCPTAALLDRLSQK